MSVRAGRFGIVADSGTVAAALGDTSDWLAVISGPHPELGRPGAVCPYLGPALADGRVAIAPLDLSGGGAYRRLAARARIALTRIRPPRSGEPNAELILPHGRDLSGTIAMLEDAQRELAVEANSYGCMVGEFYPGNPAGGLHNNEFRALSSTQPLLGLRTMVDTDLVFLDQVCGKQRGPRLAAWHGHFHDSASRSLRQRYDRAVESAESHP